MRSFFRGCALVALVTAMPSVAGVKEGVDAWQAGDFPKAVAAWRGPATAGDPDAQFNLGQAYKLGRGVPVDQNAALDWYRKAAAAGHEQAQATLGLLLFQGGKREEAMVWLKKAADQGEARAQYVVGTAYFNGDLLPKDWARAYALMTRAKAASIGAATTSLAQMEQLIPDAQRQAGLALAREMERTAQLRANDVSAPGTPLTMRSAVAPPPIGRTSIPPSTPSTPSSASATPVAPPPAAATASPQPWRAPSAVAAASPSAPPPAKAPARPASAIVAAPGGGWKIQLGAFSSADAARAAWSSLSGRAGLKALSPSYSAAGTLTRLQAGPLASRPAADQACAAVKAAGTSCFAVAP